MSLENEALKMLSTKLYYAKVSLNVEKIHKLLNLNDAYHYASNGSNGIQTEQEIEEARNKILNRIIKC